jgi:hypothetical protein
LQLPLTKKYQFIVVDNHSQEIIVDPVFIFNDSQYLSTWPNRIISFYLKNVKTGDPAGLIRFQCDRNTAWSPYRAPFASLYLVEDVQFEIIRKFIHLMIAYLKEQGITAVYIKHYPDFYSIHAPDKLITAFFFEGFQVKQMDINHFLEIKGQSFNSLIHPMQRRRIRKCIRLDYKIEFPSNNELKNVFSKIREFRIKKNIPLNIELSILNQLMKRFPTRYQLLTVLDQQRTIAATCTVEVNPKIIYNFLPASDMEYSSSSPMVFLLYHLYEYAQSRNYHYIDLGISSIKNEAQSGLIAFKEHMGGIAGTKFVLQKIIDKKNA